MFKVKLCYLPFSYAPMLHMIPSNKMKMVIDFPSPSDANNFPPPPLPFYLSAEISSSDTFPSADVLSIHPWPAFITLERELASWYLNNVIFFPR